MARTLTFLCVAALALGLSGCTRDICRLRPDTDLGALLIGLLCWGADYGVDDPPFAYIFTLPLSVDSGETLELHGDGSYDRDGEIVRYEWDVDGREGYEIDAGSHANTEAQVFIRGSGDTETRTIGLRVTDDTRLTAEYSTTITIVRAAGASPTASFTVTPNPVQARTAALFDATASVNATSFEWDFDGDGTFEGTQAARVEHGYTSEGTRNVTLRVRNAAGVADTETVAVKVIDARAAAAARRTFTARLTRVRVPNGLRDPGDVLVRGRLQARGLGPLRRFRRARWVARLDLSVDGSTARLRGRAVARFPRGGGRACLRITGRRRAGAPTGRVKLLGGRGPAARLRGGGTFTFSFRGATPRPEGRLQARLGRPRPCPWRSP
jgi:PKD domain-containing protein